MAIPLPDGWEEWPLPARERLLSLLRAAQEDDRVRWLCDRPGCDGRPHPGYPGPHARAAQRPPLTAEDFVWLILAGRGFGKTRTGAEWSWRKALRYPRGALVGATAADVRDTMVEGEAGILAVVPAAFRPKYEPSKRQLTYPNGAIQKTYSADEPERLRGPAHHYLWGDEFAAWRWAEMAWSMAQMGLRLGDHPEACLTTTPKPLPIIRELMAESDTVLTKGTTYENLDNLAPTFRRTVVRKHEGTRLGRQELLAELLDEVEGALWTLALIDADRVRVRGATLDLARIVVAVDPAAKATSDSDETGIVVVGTSEPTRCPKCGPVDEAHAFVLDDLSGKFPRAGWGKVALDAYRALGADAIVAEVNNGGDMVEATVRGFAEPGESVNVRSVHATRGKVRRAEPVVALYEKHRVHHVGRLADLEDQQTTWVDEPGYPSPDRMDALVWGLTDTLVAPRRGFAGAA